MYGLTLFLCIPFISNPPLEPEVELMRERNFKMPLIINRQKQEMASLRVFVSTDRGKSWKHVKDYTANAQWAVFQAPGDGLYWCALQILFKKGKAEPADIRDLNAVMKVRVDTKQRVLKPSQFP